MTFIESGYSAYSGQKCRAGFRLSPGTFVTVDSAMAGDGEGINNTQKNRHTRMVGAQNTKKEGVDTVHTLGFGFSCTGVGLGRTGDVFGSVADFQGERLVRVPPRARVFPVQGL
jgi:hypothetical protein